MLLRILDFFTLQYLKKKFSIRIANFSKIHFAQFAIILAKNNVVNFTQNGFYQKQGCITMCNYAETCEDSSSYNLVYNFLIQLLRLQSSVFCSTLFKRSSAWERGISKSQFFESNCFLSCNLSFAIQPIQGCQNMFSLVSLSRSKFFTFVALVSFVSHSRRSSLTLGL